MKFIDVHNIYDRVHDFRIGTVTGVRLVMAFVIVALLGWLFAELAEEVMDGETLVSDRAILGWLNSIRSAELDSFVRIATDAGGVVGVVLALVVGTGVLLWQKRRQAVAQLLLGVGGAVGINLLLKNSFGRARPDLWEQIISESSYSFPSGHAMASSALALSVVLILWQTRWRWWAVGAATVYMLFVGVSRLYLGVHYPSDIVAGWLMSAAWVVVVAVLIGTLEVKASKKD